MQVYLFSDLYIGMVSNAQSLVDVSQTGPEQEVKTDVRQTGIRTSSNRMVNFIYALTVSASRKGCDAWAILPLQDQQYNRSQTIFED